MQRISNQFEGQRPNIKSMDDVQKLLENWHDQFQDLFERLGSGKIVGGSARIGGEDAPIDVADGFIYFGDKNTLGTWRIGRIGADWVMEHQTTIVGTWVTVELSSGS